MEILIWFNIYIGYGRSEGEANANCIRNMMEFLIEDHKIANQFKESLKECKIIKI